MNFLKTILPALGASASALLSDCSGKPAAAGGAAPGSPSAAHASSDAAVSSASPVEQLFDTTKLKGDMNELLQGIASGHPDTSKLKEAGSDVLARAAAILSDTGISKMYDNDPSARAAKDMLLKLRDSIGLTPDKLEELKKAAEQLKAGH